LIEENKKKQWKTLEEYREMLRNKKIKKNKHLICFEIFEGPFTNSVIIKLSLVTLQL